MANLTQGKVYQDRESQAAPSLLSLPNELLLQIILYLSGHDLARTSQTCTLLHHLTSSDRLWHDLVSPLAISTPAPYPNFKSLYATLHPYLWLSTRLWYSDRRITGHLIVSRYSPEFGTITLHSILAPPTTSALTYWSYNPTVLIGTFNPTLNLWSEPILSLPKNPSATPMLISTTLLRAVPLPTSRQVPTMSLWPPPAIPSPSHTRNTSHDGFRGTSHHPLTTADASTSLFRLRRELRFSNLSEVETFSALDAALYTPDAAHSLRGVWVGDYASHGCEMVLFHQPDVARVRAVKLTGDINVPRGELTFVVDNLADVVRVAGEAEWPGARVVHARGHIAAPQFRDPSFTDCELIWISNDDIALHWIFPAELVSSSLPREHISRFRRVDVGCFLFGSGVQRLC